jgi:hypothetical protein
MDAIGENLIKEQNMKVTFVNRFILTLCSILIMAACQPTPTLIPSTESGVGVGITEDTCPNVLIQLGQQVTWTNQDAHDHIVRDKPAKRNGQFDSGILKTGDSFAFTFMNTGDYPYECSEDGSGTGIVTVQP